MLHREIIAVCSEFHTKPINTQNAVLVNASACGTYKLTHLWPFKGLSTHNVTGRHSTLNGHRDLRTVLKCSSELACRWV